MTCRRMLGLSLHRRREAKELAFRYEALLSWFVVPVSLKKASLSVSAAEQQAEAEKTLKEADPSWNDLQKNAWDVLRRLPLKLEVQDLTAKEYTQSRLVFTGREREIEDLREAARRAYNFEESRPPFIAFEGFSGSGKSRILLESPFRAGVAIHPLQKEGGVLSILLDFNGGGDMPSKHHLGMFTGEQYLAITLLCKTFLGHGIPEVYDTLVASDGMQHLQALKMWLVMQMIISKHRAMHSTGSNEVLLCFLLMDELQLVAPSLIAEGFDENSARKFVHDMCQSIFVWRLSKSKSEKCALMPVCAGTLIQDLTGCKSSFGCSAWGKLSISLSLLPCETGVDLLLHSLGKEYKDFLCSDAMRLLLDDVMVVPRFLEFIYSGLCRDYIKVQVCAGMVERVITTIRAMVEHQVHAWFNDGIGSDWRIVVYHCMTMIPAKADQLEIIDAAFRGYVFLEKVPGDRYIVKMPFVLLQLFWDKLGLPSLLNWFGKPLGQGDDLETHLQEMVALRMRLLQLLGRHEARLDEVLVGAEGNAETLGLKLHLPVKIMMKTDTSQLYTKSRIMRKLENAVVYKTLKNTGGVDLRMPIDAQTLCVFQAKGWTQPIPYVGVKKKSHGNEPADASIYKICEKMELSTNSSWVGVVVLTGPVSGSEADKEYLFRKFPRVILLAGERTKAFFPRS